MLRVDLTQGSIREEALTEGMLGGYIGGAGINARLLYDLLRANPAVDPLGPDNPLIFGFGPLVGTAFPCATRYTVTAKGPLTNIFGDSNAGGFFGPRVKQAGYDHIVVTGRSEKPVALLIEKGRRPELVDAAAWWGLDTYAADEKIRQHFGACETARIGPAGEHMVRYANILSGRTRVSANGRAGMGCVMGSKNLKAIIVKASGCVEVADRRRFEELARRYRDVWGTGPGTAANAEYGTLMLIAQIGTEVGANNDQAKITPQQLESYDIELFRTAYKNGKASCYRCPVGCSQKWKITQGPYNGQRGDKIEFGHYDTLGPLLGIYDFPTLLHLADLTNRLGMDCCQFGWNLAFAIECAEKGLLTDESTGGLHLGWGDAAQIEHLMLQTAQREGFGNTLAESIPAMISRIGPDAAPYGFHTKGMTFPYNRKTSLAMSLATCVATRGADHMKGHPFSALVGAQEMLERIFGPHLPAEILDTRSPVAKGRAVWWHENFKMLLDSLGLCFIAVGSTDIFGDPLILFEELGELYQAATGRAPESLFEAAERSCQIERGLNALLGIDRTDDLRRGTTRGEEDPINHPGMLDEYYHYRGCSAQGLPTRTRLLEVGLADVAEDLANMGRLSEAACPAIGELIASGEQLK